MEVTRKVPVEMPVTVTVPQEIEVVREVEVTRVVLQEVQVTHEVPVEVVREVPVEIISDATRENDTLIFQEILYGLQANGRDCRVTAAVGRIILRRSEIVESLEIPVCAEDGDYLGWSIEESE